MIYAKANMTAGNMNYEYWTIGLQSAALAQFLNTLQLSARPSLISAMEVIPPSF